MNTDLLPDPEAHFMAVVEALRETGLTVLEGWGRDAVGQEVEGDYVVVQSTSGPGGRGPAAATFADQQLAFQTTCVSGTARGAEQMRHTVAVRMLGREGITVAGRGTKVWRELAVGVDRDRDITSMFTGIDRWVCWTTPA